MAKGNILGGAEYVASNRLTRALEAVAAKLDGQMADTRGNYAPSLEHPDPSAEDLANVRHRFVEWQAVHHANIKADASKQIEPAYWKLTANVATLVYRLTVFAAAVAILYR